jgi:hypothetical protein
MNKKVEKICEYPYKLDVYVRGILLKKDYYNRFGLEEACNLGKMVIFNINNISHFKYKLGKKIFKNILEEVLGILNYTEKLNGDFYLRNSCQENKKLGLSAIVARNYEKKIKNINQHQHYTVIILIKKDYLFYAESSDFHALKMSVIEEFNK